MSHQLAQITQMTCYLSSGSVNSREAPSRIICHLCIMSNLHSLTQQWGCWITATHRTKHHIPGHSSQFLQGLWIPPPWVLTWQASMNTHRSGLASIASIGTPWWLSCGVELCFWVIQQQDLIVKGHDAKELYRTSCLVVLCVDLIR